MAKMVGARAIHRRPGKVARLSAPRLASRQHVRYGSGRHSEQRAALAGAASAHPDATELSHEGMNGVQRYCITSWGFRTSVLGGVCLGSVTRTRVPRPGSLSTLMSPRSMRT